MCVPSRTIISGVCVRVCVCTCGQVCVCVCVVDMLTDRRTGGPRRGATRCRRRSPAVRWHAKKNIIIVVIILIILIMIMYYLDDSLGYLPSRSVFSRVRASRFLSDCGRRLVVYSCDARVYDATENNNNNHNVVIINNNNKAFGHIRINIIIIIITVVI